MYILLSPAKTMNMSSPQMTINGSTPKFESDADYLAEKMRHYSQAELAGLLKISPILAKTAFERYQSFEKSGSKPALFAYDGTVFKAIGVNDFSDGDIQYAQSHLSIISILYGLLRPLDCIKAYRIAYNLKIEGVSLYRYWQEKLTRSLIEDIHKAGGIFVNLASLDVQPALDMKLLGKEVTIVTPEFKQFRDGKYVVINTHAKMARGAMARFIIKERIENPKDLMNFTHNGYQFNEMLSNDTIYVYTIKLD